VEINAADRAQLEEFMNTLPQAETRENTMNG